MKQRSRIEDIAHARNASPSSQQHSFLFFPALYFSSVTLNYLVIEAHKSLRIRFLLLVRKTDVSQGTRAGLNNACLFFFSRVKKKEGNVKKLWVA